MTSLYRTYILVRDTGTGETGCRGTAVRAFPADSALYIIWTAVLMTDRSLVDDIT
jgi:hypothetical protein